MPRICAFLMARPGLLSKIEKDDVCMPPGARLACEAEVSCPQFQRNPLWKH